MSLELSLSFYMWVHSWFNSIELASKHGGHVIELNKCLFLFW